MFKIFGLPESDQGWDREVFCLKERTILRHARPLGCRELVLAVANALLHSGRDGHAVVAVEGRVTAQPANRKKRIR